LKTGKDIAQVRPLTTEDLFRLEVLSEELGYVIETETLRQRFRQLYDHPDHLFLGIESKGVLNGFAHGARFGGFFEADRVELLGLVIHSSLRQKGLGAVLVQAVEDWAKKLNCSEVWIRSRMERTRTHGFYLQNGYEEIKSQKVFKKWIGQR